MSVSSVAAQRRCSQASRVATSVTARSTASSTQPMRAASSMAAMQSSVAPLGRNNNHRNTCDCGTAVGYGSGNKPVTAEAWDPFQSYGMQPAGRVSSKDLLQAISQKRNGQSSADAGCSRPSPFPPPPPPKKYCDSGEGDPSVADGVRRTADFLCDMWCQQKLCDVVLRCCGDGNAAEDTILAHKVLYRPSRYMYQHHSSPRDVVIETRVLVSRRLEDKNQSWCWIVKSWSWS